MNSTKPELRKLLKSRRLSMNEGERAQKSQSIREKLEEILNDSGVTSLHCYDPIRSLGEVDVSGLKGDYDMYVPREIDGEWAVVPAAGNREVPGQFDAIIVPMLGFDENLQRLGYGGGYYDKFLATQPSAKKIGVCFEAGKLDRIPYEPHDVALDIIITEERVYTP